MLIIALTMACKTSIMRVILVRPDPLKRTHRPGELGAAGIWALTITAIVILAEVATGAEEIREAELTAAEAGADRGEVDGAWSKGQP
jgi:hypothetical protein